MTAATSTLSPVEAEALETTDLFADLAAEVREWGVAALIGMDLTDVPIDEFIDQLLTDYPNTPEF